MDIIDAVNALAPGAQWILNGDNNYGSIQWKERSVAKGGIAKPTESEVAAKLNELLAAEPMIILRKERDNLLTETDWVVTKYTELGQAIPNDWKTYRQSLRDLPSTQTPEMDDVPGNPLRIKNVTWPTKPGS